MRCSNIQVATAINPLHPASFVFPVRLTFNAAPLHDAVAVRGTGSLIGGTKVLHLERFEETRLRIYLK